MIRIASWRQHGIHKARETKAIGCHRHSQTQEHTGKHRLAQPTWTAGEHTSYSDEAVQKREAKKEKEWGNRNNALVAGAI